MGRGRGNLAYIREENARDTATSVHTLLMALFGIIATAETSLVACDGVLVSFETAIAVHAVGA